MLQRILKTVGLTLWLPSLAGAATFVITWLVWFFIEPDCVPTPTAPCPLLPWGRYITLHILGECILYSALVMTALGGSDIMLFIREMMRSEELKKEAAARLEQEKLAADARLEQQKQDSEQRRADDQKRWEKEQERADLMAARQEALMERTFQLIQEERNAVAAERQAAADARAAAAVERAEERAAAEVARQAAAAERHQQDERIRQLETQLAQLAAQPPPPHLPR